jgi:hypothetical protein
VYRRNSTAAGVASPHYSWLAAVKQLSVSLFLHFSESVKNEHFPYVSIQQQVGHFGYILKMLQQSQ